MTHLMVFMDDRHIGNLIMREKSSTFIYSDAWVSDGFAIAPEMPVHIKEHHAVDIHGIFSDSSPDRWGRKLIQRKMGKTRISEQECILGVADTLRQGALRYSLDGGKTFEGQENRIPPVSSLPKFIRLTESIMKGEDHDYSELISNASLGGARAKIVVVDGDRQWIAKIPQIYDQDDIEGWEYVCLRLARKAGITVPACSLHGDKNSHTLLVERFDRNEEQRIHYMSAMTLMGLKDGDECTYIDLAFEIVNNIGPECLPELYKRMLLNIMLSNTDDHLRNHGFLYHQGWRLAPAFDITISQRPYASIHALRLNGEDPDSFKTALAIHDFFGLSKDQAVRILSGMVRDISQWRIVATQAGISNVESMADYIFRQEACDALDE
jgi:serine/threonine-protein kinase HipA